VRKGQINPRDLALSFGIFLLVIGSVVYLISTVTVNNPNAVDTESLEAFNQSFNLLDEYQSETETLKAQVETVTADEGKFGFLNSLIRGSFKTLQTLFATFTFLFAVVKSLNSVFGIPSFFVAGIVSIVVIIITFSILRVIFQRDI